VPRFDLTFLIEFAARAAQVQASKANSQRPTNYQRKRQKQTYPSPQRRQWHAAAPSSSPCENHLKIAVNEGRIIKLA
jgi:hypothetical protein